MKKEEISWILYDVANSAFVLIIVTMIMPIFFKEYAAAGLSGSESTALWGYANSAAALVIALASPIMGTLADYEGNKMKMFFPFFVTGIISTLLLVFVGQGGWISCLIIFMAAKIAWSGTLVFYDAFLVDITDEHNMDKVSSRGYGWGYIGSVIPFVIVILLILSAKDTPGQYTYFKIGFVITALWWLVFSIPMIKNVKQKYFIPHDLSPVKNSFRRMISGIKEIKKFKQIYLFLIAYFFYIDGVDTIISMAVAYGIDAGLGTVLLIGAILMIQVLAFPFSIVYGKLSEIFSAGTMIQAGIIVYVIITVISFFLPVIESENSKKIVFYLLSFLVATSMGGIQALSRSYFGKIIPPERSAEFFGLYNIFGKFAAIMGPFLMGAATDISGNSRYGILCIILLFAAGWILFRKAERVNMQLLKK
ncbi:MAG TPA: MFS transporter [Spirochaetota bacterium]|nr:MFS transporter [Spirochaetota bacterium]